MHQSTGDKGNADIKSLHILAGQENQVKFEITAGTDAYDLMITENEEKLYRQEISRSCGDMGKLLCDELDLLNQDKIYIDSIQAIKAFLPSKNRI